MSEFVHTILSPRIPTRIGVIFDTISFLHLKQDEINYESYQLLFKKVMEFKLNFCRQKQMDTTNRAHRKRIDFL